MNTRRVWPNRRSALFLFPLLFAGSVRAEQMDCLSFDGFEGGLAPTAPMEEVRWLHNCMRRTAEPKPVPRMSDLKWSATVANSAQSWADQCSYGHPGGHGYGENIAAGTSGFYDEADLTMLWIDEYVHYNYANNTCAAGEVCGHYTQVVWRNTQQVGCATKLCATLPPLSGNNWLYLVCRYSPPGNFIGQWPY